MTRNKTSAQQKPFADPSNPVSPVSIDIRSVWSKSVGGVAANSNRAPGSLGVYEGLENLAARVITSLKDRLALHRLIRLRQRYIMTRANKVRLRYVTACLVSCMLATGVMFASSLANLIEDQSDVYGSAQDMPYEYAAHDDLSAVFQTHISEGIRKAAIAIKKAPLPLSRELKVGKGDTIAGVLQDAGVGGDEAFKIVEALRPHYDPRKIVAGQKIDVSYKAGANDSLDLTKLTMKIDPVKEVIVRKNDNSEFVAELHEKEIVRRSYARTAEIETSLYGSAAKAGIPQRVIAEVIRTYSWDIDFQRDIRQGDKIEILYDTYETEDGEFAKNGDVLYANLTINGKHVPIYRYEMADGRVDYFQPDGHSIRKALMKTPIDGARLSSGFGMRKHPVLGYNKMHKGADFAAPTGTPIYAAGDGVIEVAGRQSSYGNYVRIRHNSTLKTAYAHMRKFASGISKGVRVEQGEVIGYVGTTGRSTGPHLHYEVLVNGTQKNPNSVDLPTGEQLAGKDMDRFKSLMTTINQQYVALSEGLKFAEKDADKKNPTP